MNTEDQALDLNVDEICILRFLNNWPDAYVSQTEIARRADGKARYRANPRWTAGALSQLRALNLVEADRHGRYRLITDRKKRLTVCLGGKQRFVSPYLRAILEKHGRKFGRS